MSSSRLPGKVMRPVMGKPMLELQIERIKKCRRADKLIVVTSTNPEDNPIELLCRKLGIEFFRGDLNNVLDRFYQACRPYRAKAIVRLTGDCPLTDPEKIDDLITFFQNSDYDYANNCTLACLPHGLDAEIFTQAALKTAWANATLPSEREHVTPYMENPENGFSLGHLFYEPTHPHLRWCVDEPEDFELVTKIYQALYPANPLFTTSHIIELMEQHPELARINNGFARDEGYQISLEQDRVFLA